jgi:PEP-CTERM motif
MRLGYSLLAIVLFASSAFSARADNFKLSWTDGDSFNPQPETLTFYLPPTPIPPAALGSGIDTFATASLNGIEFLAEFQFVTPENFDQVVGFLIIEGGPFVSTESCGNCFANFNSDDALINDLSSGDPYLSGTHTGLFFVGTSLGEVPATLVITPDASTVPEPSSILLLGSGILMLGFAARRSFRHGSSNPS